MVRSTLMAFNFLDSLLKPLQVATGVANAAKARASAAALSGGANAQRAAGTANAVRAQSYAAPYTTRNSGDTQASVSNNDWNSYGGSSSGSSGSSSGSSGGSSRSSSSGGSSG